MKTMQTPAFQKKDSLKKAEIFFSQVKGENVAEPLNVSQEHGVPLFLKSNFAPSSPPPIQAKLKVSQPDDDYEREADRMAERVIRRSKSSVLSKVGWRSAMSSPEVTRDDSDVIQRRPGLGASLFHAEKMTGHGPLPVSIKNREGRGRPLASSVKHEMESHFQGDFNRVRIHTDHDAAALAHDLNADAFTHGQEIFFNRGKYAPETTHGKKLLAHELTHVVQQPQGVIAREVARGYPMIRSNLSYSIVDWAITETECDQALQILSSLTPTDLEDTVRRMQSDGLVTRLVENTSSTSRISNATLIGRIQSLSSLGSSLQAGLDAALEAAGESSREPAARGEIRAPETFDPCLVDTYGLTNSALLSYYQRVHSVVRRGRSTHGYFDNRNLQRRLITERNRRVAMGHAWLATMPESIPQNLRRIIDGPSGSFQVQDVPGPTVAGDLVDHSSSPVMTQTQFNRFLQTRNIERVNADTYRMRRRAASVAPQAMFGASATLGGLYNAPGQLPLMWPPRGAAPLAPGQIPPWPRLPGVFYRPEYLTRLPRYMQTDALLHPPAMNPEVSARMRGALRAYRRVPGVPFREVNPLIVDPSSRVTAGTAAFAVTDIPNLGRSTTFGASPNALPQNLRGAPGFSMGTVFTPINSSTQFRNHAEHVALENLRRQIDRSLALGEITRADLRGRTVHVMVEQAPCSSCGAGAGGGEPGPLGQFARRYPELTLEVRNMRELGRAYVYRSGVLLNPTGQAPALPMEINSPTGRPVESVMTPEFARTMQFGGGARGELRAMGVSGLRGGGFAGVIAVATSSGVMLLDTRDHPQWAQELALTGGLGVGAGALGSSAEQLIISRGTGAMVNSIVETGASRMTPRMVTGFGRAGGGAVGAMFIEGISMGLLEEREHSGAEIATRMTRSGALGAGSIWAGAATGSAVGSVVPVAGTAVGFVVGLVAGGILYFIGDRVVPGGRDDWDAYEAGCHFRQSSTGSSLEVPVPFCFTGKTQVTMANGTRCRINGLNTGDTILSYNESDRTLQTGKVLKIERRIAPDHLLLRIAGSGAEVGVTGEHPIHTQGRWLPAKQLSPGSLVTGLNGQGNRVADLEILNVKTEVRPVYVYNLSVSDYHTFFADGILAHNKNM